eukprot:gene5931-6001_t
MPRHATPLTAKAVMAKPPGRYADGNRLHLLVKPSGARSWVFRYVFEGKRIDMGLGPAGNDPAAVTLVEAREMAGQLSRQLREGINPSARRKAEKESRRVALQQVPEVQRTFRAVAKQYVSAHEAGWRNAKHAVQWTSTLETYAYPHFGDVSVAEITTGQVMLALTPIWNVKPETASRVRGRIEAVLDYATAPGWRTGPNPARWKGHLKSMLPERSKLGVVEHHAALPWRDMAGFMSALRALDNMAASALELTILCATRSGETLGAQWREIDLSAAVWTIPAARMKAKREHRIPLTASAVAVLQRAAASRVSTAPEAFVFPGNRKGKPLSSMAMAMLLRRMKRDDVTVHGFRSTFRDWCGEATATDSDTAEAALAHTIRDKVRAAYQRGDLFEKRRRLMDAWAEYCGRPATKTDNVVAIRAAADTADTRGRLIDPRPAVPGSERGGERLNMNGTKAEDTTAAAEAARDCLSRRPPQNIHMIPAPRRTGSLLTLPGMVRFRLLKRANDLAQLLERFGKEPSGLGLRTRALRRYLAIGAGNVPLVASVSSAPLPILRNGRRGNYSPVERDGGCAAMNPSDKLLSGETSPMAPRRSTIASLAGYPRFAPLAAPAEARCDPANSFFNKDAGALVFMRWRRIAGVNAARVIGAGLTTLYALIGAGKIVAKKSNGRTLIPAESLRAYLANLPDADIGTAKASKSRTRLLASISEPAFWSSPSVRFHVLRNSNSKFALAQMQCASVGGAMNRHDRRASAAKGADAMPFDRATTLQAVFEQMRFAGPTLTAPIVILPTGETLYLSADDARGMAGRMPSMRVSGGVGADGICRDNAGLAALTRDGSAEYPPRTISTDEDAERAARRKQNRAMGLWEGAQAVTGTLAATYLIARALPTMAASAALRFAPSCRHPETADHPAMLALVRDAAGRPVAIHRTYLRHDGQGKADVTPPKASLGPVWGGAIRLDPLAAELVIGEGIETAAAAGVLIGLPAWAALSAGNLATGLILPPEVRTVVIAADRDAHGEAAANAAARRWQTEGRRVRIARPDRDGVDFNDILRDVPELPRPPTDAEMLANPDMTVLRSNCRRPPDLPLDVFGVDWASFVVGAAKAASCPPDYVAGPLLATASALIGNARWAQANPGWSEPPHLWVGVVGDSGGGKSPGADALMRDVVPDIERRMGVMFPDQQRVAKAKSAAYEAALEQWKADVKVAVKKGNSPPAPPAGDPPVEPQCPRLRQNDVTIERVATLLATAAPKGLLIVRDELAGWIAGMTTYNEAGRAFWLETYGGRPYRVERQKHPQPIDVPYLAVAVTGGTQPDKLAELMLESDDGLLARVCWMWPERVPFRLGRLPPNTAWATEALDRLRLLDLQQASSPEGRPAPFMVPVAQTALSYVEAFAQEMQQRQQDAAGLMRSAFGKARGTALRVSLVLEYLWWCAESSNRPAPTEISEAAFKAAAHFVNDYLMPMAERVYGDAATSPRERHVTTLAKWIIKIRASEVHVRKLQREVRLPGLTDASTIHDAARGLVDAGWLMEPVKGSREGRGKAAYTVNPRVFEAWRATEGSRGEVSAVSTASTPNIGMHLESRGSNVKSLPKDDGDLQAIYAEPALPAPGTPERERHDKKQSDMEQWMTDAQKYALALRQQQEARQPVIAKLRGVALGAIKSGKPMPLVRRAVAHAASQLRPLPPESVLVEALAEAQLSGRVEIATHGEGVSDHNPLPTEQAQHGHTANCGQRCTADGEIAMGETTLHPLTDSKPSSMTSTERVRALRERRKNGLVRVTFDVRQSEADQLVSRGFLDPSHRSDRYELCDALGAFLDEAFGDGETEE